MMNIKIKNKQVTNMMNNVLVTVYSNTEDLPKNILLPKQCHSDNVIEINTGNEKLENCDALITKNKKFYLGIRTADCAAVFY